MIATRLLAGMTLLVWAAWGGVCACAQTPIIERSLKRLEAAPPQAPDCIDFAVLADSNTLKPLEQAQVFRQCLAEFNILKPNLVIEAGDLVLGGAAEGVPPQWDLFAQTIAGLDAPYFPAPGNHDINDAATEKLWCERVGPTHYAFRYGQCLFIALDTEEQGALNRISDAQTAWLKQQLDSSDAANVFIFLHEPLFEQEGDPDIAEATWNKQWANVAETFKGHPVRAVFAGHEHIYRDCGVRDGVHYVICGGASVYGMGGPEDEGSFNHYLFVRVRGTQVSWAVIKPYSVLASDVVTSDRIDELYNIRNKWIGESELSAPWGEGADGEVKITIANPHEAALQSTLAWQATPGWSVSPMSVDYEVAPKGTKELVFRVKGEAPVDARFPVPFFTTRYGLTQHGPAVEVKQDLRLAPRVKVVKAAGVKLDGAFDEWKNAQWARMQYPVKFEGKDKADLDAQVAFMWDSEWLYMAMDTHDNEHCQPYAGDIVWAADCVEMFLNDWSWGLSLTQKGPEVFLYWGVDRSAEEVNTEVKLSAKREGTRTTYEAAFPLSCLTPLQLAPGHSFRFNALMNDLDAQGPEKERHWLTLVPADSEAGDPRPMVEFILAE